MLASRPLQLFQVNSFIQNSFKSEILKSKIELAHLEANDIIQFEFLILLI